MSAAHSSTLSCGAACRFCGLLICSCSCAACLCFCCDSCCAACCVLHHPCCPYPVPYPYPATSPCPDPCLEAPPCWHGCCCPAASHPQSISALAVAPMACCRSCPALYYGCGSCCDPRCCFCCACAVTDPYLCLFPCRLCCCAPCGFCCCQVCPRGF